MRRGKRERTSKVLALPGVDVRQRAVGGTWGTSIKKQPTWFHQSHSPSSDMVREETAYRLGLRIIGFANTTFLFFIYGDRYVCE